MTKNTDPLDLAYVAIGAASAWERVQRINAARYNVGHVEYIAACTESRILDFLQEVYDEVAEAWGGVWVYDVCKPFGLQDGEALLLGNAVDFETLIIELVCDEL